MADIIKYRRKRAVRLKLAKKMSDLPLASADKVTMEEDPESPESCELGNPKDEESSMIEGVIESQQFDTASIENLLVDSAHLQPISIVPTSVPFVSPFSIPYKSGLYQGLTDYEFQNIQIKNNATLKEQLVVESGFDETFRSAGKHPTERIVHGSSSEASEDSLTEQHSVEFIEFQQLDDLLQRLKRKVRDQPTSETKKRARIVAPSNTDPLKEKLRLFANSFRETSDDLRDLRLFVSEGFQASSKFLGAHGSKILDTMMKKDEELVGMKEAIKQLENQNTTLTRRESWTIREKDEVIVNLQSQIKDLTLQVLSLQQAKANAQERELKRVISGLKVNEAPKYVIALSGFKEGTRFDSNLKKMIVKCVSLFSNTQLITDSDGKKYDYNCNITHMITPTTTKTLKSLAALLSKAWIISDPNWIMDSLKAKEWLPESSYGARLTVNPFEGMSIYPSSSFTDASKLSSPTSSRPQILHVLWVECSRGRIVDKAEDADYILVNERPNPTITGNTLNWAAFMDLIPFPHS